jgi:hypothetical protein
MTFQLDGGWLRADESLVRELGATPVRYGPAVIDAVRDPGGVQAVFDAAGKSVLADAIAPAGDPGRVITLSDPAAADTQRCRGATPPRPSEAGKRQWASAHRPHHRVGAEVAAKSGPPLKAHTRRKS